MTTRTAALREQLANTPAPTPADGAALPARRLDPARDLLDSMRGEIAAALPDVLPLDMFMRVALTGFRKTPDLAACNRSSLFGALLDCARLGLAPCTEQAHLVPFKHEVSLIVGYEGYVQLMYRSGQVEQVVCELVYDTDEWEYSLGDGGRFFHRPNILANPRGKPLFAYAYASLTGGGRTRVAIVTEAEALRLQREYTRGRNKVWQTNFEAMWLKTAVRRVQKFAPKSPELRRALAADGATYDGTQVIPADPGVIDGETVEQTAPTSAPPATEPDPAPVGPPAAMDPEPWDADRDPWDGIEVAQPGGGAR